MSNACYTDEFKAEAVGQILERGYSVADIFDYIEGFYSRKRRHEYLNYMSPVDFRDRFMGK